MKLKRLNREQPHSEICGLSRRQFEQEGLLFDERGYEIREGVTPPADDEPLPLTDEPVIDYRKLPIVQLKILVESFGEVYQNKASALDFLEGRTANSIPIG